MTSWHDSSLVVILVIFPGHRRVEFGSKSIWFKKYSIVIFFNVYGATPADKLFLIHITYDEGEIYEHLLFLLTFIFKYGFCVHCSENCLPSPADPQKLAPVFTKVTILYLNKMNYTWEQVRTI